MSETTYETVSAGIEAPVAHPIGLFELVLEVADLAAAERFYRDGIGLPVINRWQGARQATWFDLGSGGALGLWPVETGGAVALHGGRGGAHVHFALRVPYGTLDAMQARLERLGYAVEPHEFDREPGATYLGNRALYLDDPDGNVLELTERRTLWTGARVTD